MRLSRESLLVLDPDERRPVLEAYLKVEAARALRVPSSAVEPGRPLSALGLDSLAAIELRAGVERDLGVSPSIAGLLSDAGVEDLASEVLRRLEEPEGAGNGLRSRGETEGEHPLSYGQRALWFLARMAPESAAYNLAAAASVPGRLDVAALGRAWQALTRRHPAMRLAIDENGGEPRQRIAAPGAPSGFAVVDAVSCGEARIRKLLEDEAERPFDLARGPLYRLLAVARPAGEHLLLLSVHHVVADFWSLSVVARELAALYRLETEGRGERLPLPAVSFTDWARFQEESLAGEEGERLFRYWRERLAGVPPVLELPGDRPRPAVPNSRGGRLFRALGADFRDGLRSLADSCGATVFMTLLAGFQALLGRYSGQRRLAVGTPTSGRFPAGVEGVLGYFVNPLVVAVDLGGDPSPRELVARVRGGVLGDFEHQDYPFALLTERLHPERAAGRSPLFQVMFAWQRPPRPEEEALASFALGWDGAELALGGLVLRSRPLERRAVPFDLSLVSAERSGEIGLSLEYASDLFDVTTARRILGHLETLLRAMAARPDDPLSELPWLSRTERAQLSEWSRGESARAQHGSIPRRFDARVGRMPEAIALVCGGERLSYGRLGRRCHGLARHLRTLGVGPEQAVGIAVERTSEAATAILGVLAAGGVCLPLDPSWPEQRRAWILEDAAARVLITPRSLLRVRHDAGDGEAPESALPPAVEVRSESLAYVIYTSGTTGRPKGVGVPHRQILRLLDWGLDHFGLDERTKVFQTLSYAFDFGFFELVSTLLCGGTLYSTEAGGKGDFSRLVDAVTDAGVDTIHATPSFFREVVAQGRRLPSLSRVHLGGEALDRGLVRRIRELAGEGCAIYNGYGPTEATVTSAIHRVRALGRGQVPIGRAAAGNTLHVLDRRGGALPVGVVGELCVGGSGVARGYLRRGAATAEKFVPDPFCHEPGGRLYRTGDRVRWRVEGELEFLGRTDHQVKLRGFRIEPEEIAAVLADHPAVYEAVVGVRDERLVAHVVAPPEVVVELGEYLRARLPGYMVPAAFVALAELPLTANGKVDRAALGLQALPDPVFEPRGAAPRSPAEELVAGIWSEVLGLGGGAADRIGPEADFFALGGHSLLATQVVSRIRRVFGAELPVRAVFEEPTLGALAARVECLTGSGADGRTPPIEPVARGRVPLSFAQQRLWFLDQLEPGRAVYNIPIAVELAGTLDTAVLAASLGEIVRRHESLRTTFESAGGEPVQVISAGAEVRLPAIDLTAVHYAARRGEAARVERRMARLPFDLARGPLLHAALLGVSGEEHVLVLILHHIVADGWSMGVLVRDLSAMYRALATGESSTTPGLAIHYADYAVWQRRWLEGERYRSQLEYWRRELAGGPVLELPADRPRPPVETFRGTQIPVALPAAVAAGARALARGSGSTLYMVLLAVFKTLLYLSTGQRDLAVGSPIANRSRVELEGLIGFFANTLVMRTRPSPVASFRELLARVREVALGAYAHQDLPFERLVEELQPERDMSRNPLFQVMLVLQNAPLPDLDLPGLTFRARGIESGTSKFDLILFLWEAGGTLEGSFEYNTDLYDETTALRFVAHFETLLGGVTADPDRPLAACGLLRPAERHQLLVEWNDTGAGELAGRPVHELASARAALVPDSVALVSGETALTYRELGAEVNKLAHYLAKLGVGPESLVGICVERSPAMVIALWAVLKAGGAGVALDLTYPAERLARVIEDAGLAALLTLEPLLASLPAGRAPRVCLDRDRQEIGRESAAEPPARACLDHPMYAIYTSGSTGEPKGIVVTHRAFGNLLAEQLRLSPLARRARTAQFSTFGFCVSFQEIFSVLCSGATLVIVGERQRKDVEGLWRLLDTEAVERLYLPYAALKQLAEVCGPGRRVPDALVDVVTAGEQLQVDRGVRALFDRLGGCSLHNQYGASETHVVSSFRLPGGPDGWPDIAPVGRPVANVRVHLASGILAPVPVGVAGELYAGGACLPRCYLGDARLTAGKLVPDPFGRAPGARLYRTGDLARHLAGGAIEYFGRIDTQVKIRGFRVELGEIEMTLKAHPAVRGAAVVAHRAAAGGSRLTAYTVGEAAPEALGLFLKERLPEYMVPRLFVPLEALPLNANGKLDRGALPVPDLTRLESSAPYVAPRDSVEELMERIWAELLEVERMGVHDNFFASGGHSLLATRLISRVRDNFRVALPLRNLFEAPTIAELARLVAAREAVPGQTEKLAGVVLRVRAMDPGEVAERLSAKRMAGGQYV